MSAESAHLSTFGAETVTEAEIRSTSNPACFISRYNICIHVGSPSRDLPGDQSTKQELRIANRLDKKT